MAADLARQTLAAMRQPTPEPDDARWVEGSQVSLDWARDLARLLKRRRHVVYVIDYARPRGLRGSTFQACRRHRFADPLERPGAQDLTWMPDFRALASVFHEEGLAVFGPLAQGAWLDRVGGAARCDALIRANPGRMNEVWQGYQRLVARPGMGETFVVCGVTDGRIPPGFGEKERWSPLPA